MYVRLAFAVASNLEPDILIIDEVLAVGDASFPTKMSWKNGRCKQEHWANYCVCQPQHKSHSESMQHRRPTKRRIGAKGWPRIGYRECLWATLCRIILPI